MRRVPPFFALVLLVLAITPWRAVAAEPDQIRAELAAQARGDLKKFYQPRGFVPLWTAAGAVGSEADALLASLASARLDGLKPASYKIAGLQKAIAEAQSGDAKALARAELRLSAAFARFVRDQRKPAMNDMTWLNDSLKPRKLSPAAVLGAAALAAPFSRYAATMGWMSPHYVRIRDALARAEAVGADEDTMRRLRRDLARARILPGPWTHHIVVDAASARLWFYQAGKAAGTMRVIVGAPETPTPMLAGMLQYAILNPYWNVPVSLAQSRIAPRVLAGRSLRSQGYEALSDWSADPAPLDAAQIDWSAVAAGTQEIRLRQRPGPANAMGRVKFIFPNDDGIYLHDTPERRLFASDDRHLSNGCVRLEDAATLGKWLLGRSIRGASKAPEQPVALPVPVPVFLTYFTDGDDADDVYGRDR